MPLRFKTIPSPVGTLLAGAGDEGLCFVEFVDAGKQDAMLSRLGRELDAVLEPGEHGHLQQLEQELHAYFNRQRTTFTVPLQLVGTDFQKSVWKSLLEIPYGKTWSYKQQALWLNNLPALRAIASANGQNRHAIVLPCHRVIGSNGSLTGYAGGIARKAWLLKFEQGPQGQTLELPFE